MKWPVVLVVVVPVVAGLVGCAPRPSADTVAGRCHQQEDKDPAVQTIMMGGPMHGMGLPYQNELAQARTKAFNDCMIAAGVARPGGVEPVNAARYPLGNYPY